VLWFCVIGAPLTAKNDSVILLVHGILQNPLDIYI
jgi:hypothetical protein